MNTRFALNNMADSDDELIPSERLPSDLEEEDLREEETPKYEYSEDKDYEISPKQDHFPLCIVWCPLPVLSWFCPPIGHLGIVTSTGVIHDFAGPYFVNRNKKSLIFGRATKYYRVDMKVNGKQYDLATIEQWDKTIEKTSGEFDHLMHNLICQNCHSHVARVLNRMKFKKFQGWNTFFLILFMLAYGKTVSFPRFLKTYLPFFIIVSLFLSMVFVIYRPI